MPRTQNAPHTLPGRRPGGPLAAAVLAWLLALLLNFLAPLAQAAAPLPLSGYARPVVEQLLAERTAGLPGKVEISIDTPPSGALPPCEALEAFLPGGARLPGRVSVGLRCPGSAPWSRYVQARVALIGTYYVAARQIDAGQALQPGDAQARQADLARLPASVVLEAGQLAGMVAVNRINAGAPLRREQLRGVPVVQQGQALRVVTRGPGFTVSAEGKALTSAAVGALVRVRLAGGQLVSGIVGADGSVERAH